METMALRFILLCAVGTILLFRAGGAQTLQDSQNLYDNLLTGYNKHIRPALNQAQPVTVNISFDFVTVRELDEINGKLSIAGLLYMYWVDPRMTWNPLQYNGTSSLTIPITEVWKPDLIIAHPIDSNSVVSIGYYHRWINVRYLYDGSARYAPGDIMSTTCSIDVAYYPFDTQHCEMIFIPWGMLVSEIEFNAIRHDAYQNYFITNGEWDLVEATTKSVLYGRQFPTFVLDIRLKRRATFVVVNVILPILAMGFLNALVFCLPSKSGERVSYAMTVLLAIAVFLTLVGDNLPKTSEPMSTICYFLLANLIMSSVIMLLTILNLNIYHRKDSRPIPRCLAAIVRLVLRKKRRGSDVTASNGIENIDLSSVNAIHVAGNEKQPIETISGKKKWAFDLEGVTDDSSTDPCRIGDDATMTWIDVSHAFDEVAFATAMLWLIFSNASFFIMVITQKTPTM